MDATLSKTIQLPEKPHGGPFRQQRLAAWQLTYTPASLMITYSVFFIVTLAFGIAITITYVRTVEVEVPYSSVQSCSYEDQVLRDISASLEGSSSPIFAPSGCEPIEIPFTINENMRQPVLMYYKLSNYFHNFFALTNSRDDNQLAGGTATESRCDPFYKIDERVISPCGALAWSLFNDTFRVFRLVENSSSTSDSSPLKRELICDTSSFDAHNEPIGVNVNTHCRKNGIAWRSDINTRFRPAPEDDDTIVTFRGVPSASNIFERFGWYANENGHSIPDVSDQDLMVWIHPSTRSTFQKNFRFFDMDLPAGNYLLEVTQRYPTSDFNGGKTIGFVEVPWTRTRYLTMGIVNIVLAGIGVFWFVVFASLHCVGITSNDSNKLNLAASQRF